jgi:hypothetical protein
MPEFPLLLKSQSGQVERNGSIILPSLPPATCHPQPQHQSAEVGTISKLVKEYD